MRLKHLLFAITVLFPLTPVQADTPFPVRGRSVVVDGANVISPSTKEYLSKKLTQWEITSRHQLIVVTVASLNADTAANYGYRLGRAWHLGRTGIDDAVIFLYNAQSNKVRIEVGKGLEPVLTDAMSKYILNTYVSPKLHRKDVNGAITDGVDAIVRYIDQHEADVITAPKPVVVSSKATITLLTVSSIVLAVLLTIIFYGIRKRKKKVTQPQFYNDPPTANSLRYIHLPLYNPSQKPFTTYYEPSQLNPLHSIQHQDTVIAPVPVAEYIPKTEYQPQYPDLKTLLASDDSDDTDTSDTTYTTSNDDNGFTSDNTDTDSFLGGGADSD